MAGSKSLAAFGCSLKVSHAPRIGHTLTSISQSLGLVTGL